MPPLLVLQLEWTCRGFRDYWNRKKSALSPVSQQCVMIQQRMMIRAAKIRAMPNDAQNQPYDLHEVMGC